MNWWNDELKRLYGDDYVPEEWKTKPLTFFPKQENDFDCGMFVCVAAKHWCTDHKFKNKQRHMPIYRQIVKREMKNRALMRYNVYFYFVL